MRMPMRLLRLSLLAADEWLAWTLVDAVTRSGGHGIVFSLAVRRRHRRTSRSASVTFGI